MSAPVPAPALHQAVAHGEEVRPPGETAEGDEDKDDQPFAGNAFHGVGHRRCGAAGKGRRGAVCDEI